MIVDEYGTVGYTQQEIIDYLRINPNFDIHGLLLTDGEQYISAKNKTYIDIPELGMWNSREYDFTVEEYHQELQKVWLMPDEYCDLDVVLMLRNLCKTPEELNRVNAELKLYEKFELINLLRYLKYLRDMADKNHIVWGLGRGSSCCSYCLYLLQIHRVDSLRYGLDITEFLRA